MRATDLDAEQSPRRFTKITRHSGCATFLIVVLRQARLQLHSYWRRLLRLAASHPRSSVSARARLLKKPHPLTFAGRAHRQGRRTSLKQAAGMFADLHSFRGEWPTRVLAERAHEVAALAIGCKRVRIPPLSGQHGGKLVEAHGEITA